MDSRFLKIIVVDILLFFVCTLLFIFDYKTEPFVIILFAVILNLIYLYLDSIKIRFDMISDKKAIINANIDNFRLIKLYYNDKGNEIIKEVYKIIKKNLSSLGIVKKYSGYYVILEKYNNRNELIGLINRINNETQQLFNCDVFTVSLSFGIQICNDGDFESNENKATIACINAKKEQMSLYSFYNDEETETEIREKRILNGLVKSLKNNDFEVYFQPKFDNKNNKIVGSEALARLKQNGKIVPAKDFIDVAEKYNFTTALDKYVLKEVCKKINELKKENLKFNVISVNVSRNTLCEKSMIEYYESILEKYGINKKDIELEVTERNANGFISPTEKIHELSEKFNVSIDDFGIGNSSLSMLREHKIKIIKIDRKFIVDETPSGRKILDNIIKLIQELGFEIVCEGVETKKQEEYLKDRGCTIIQGFLYSEPLAFDEYKKALKEGI